MDSSHITIFDLHLSSDWFDKFEIMDDNVNNEFGINTHIISKILNTKSDKQMMRIYCDENNCDKLGLIFMEMKMIMINSLKSH